MYVKIKTMKLPFWEKIRTKMLFYILATILITIFGLYAYLVNRTIMNVVAREKTYREISTLSTSIGELEFKYMSIRNNITLELAYEKGFHDAVPSQFISRGSSALSFNTR